MKIIIGLGNPGKKYKNTPHNSGFSVLDELASAWKKEWQLTKIMAVLEQFLPKEQKIILVKPQTFMNASGQVIGKLLAKFKDLKFQDDLWVIHDDLDLALGRLKIVKNRGSAGHKGVESIIKSLGTKNFVRFRLGTGMKKQKGKEVVLAEFKGKEKKIFERMIKKGVEAVVYALNEGIEKAMNKYNQKVVN